MKNVVLFAIILVFFFALIIYPIPDAQALSIFDYDFCKKRFEDLKIIGSQTYAMMFSNSEAARFCMSMFEEGIIPREVKGQYEISRLGIQLDVPKNWSGSQIDTDNMTIVFVIPDKRQSDTMEPLWRMLIVADKSDGQDLSDKIFKEIAKSLNDVPHFMDTCTFEESRIVEINETKFNEDVVVCIDRRLSLFVTISSHSFTAQENEIFFISATRHLPKQNPENAVIDFLQTLEVKKILDNIEDTDIQVSESKKDTLPSWSKKYITLWGEGKITDRKIISLFNFIVKNNLLNDSYSSDYGFYNETKIPDWFRNNAIWFGKGLISEDEFVDSFKYLLENKVIWF